MCNFEQDAWCRTGHGAIPFPKDCRFGATPMPEFKPVSSPQIAAIKRPGCARCRQDRMLLSKLEPGPSGFDTRTFECQKCGHRTIVVSDDPMTSDACGWLASE